MPTQHELLEEITRILELITKDAAPRELFPTMLESLLRLTDSDYGYIGEVFGGERPWLRTWAITDVSWDDATRELYRGHVEQGDGLEFRRLDTLFGWGLLGGGRVVIANDPSSDPRHGGRPGGHPPLESFLAVPVHHGGQLIGQMAVANRAGGYDRTLAGALAPFTTAVASVLASTRLDRERQDALRLTETQRRQGRALARHMRGAVSIVGDDNKLRHVIGGAMLGLDPRRGVPHDTNHFVHPDDRTRLTQAFHDIRRTGESQYLLSRFLDVDGQTRVLELTVQDMRDDPDIDGLVVTAHDVTSVIQAEQRAEQTARELSALVAGLRDGVLFLDRDRRVVYTNDRFCELWGYTGGVTELIGTQSAPGTGFDDPSIAKAFERLGRVVTDPAETLRSFRASYTKAVPELGSVVERTDGLVIESDYLPVHQDDEVVGHIWVHRDVTERYRAEQARADDLIRAAEQNEALRHLHRLKTEFIAMVSHELATPVTSVVNFAEMVEEGLHTDSEPDRVREFAVILQRNAQRLLRLVNDLLTIAKLDAGATWLHYETTDLATLVGTAVDELRPELDAKAITLQTELETGEATLDPGRIEQVVKNLLTNAIKFTDIHGTITVGVRRIARSEADDPADPAGDGLKDATGLIRADSPDDDGWELAVRDNGIGVADEDLAHLFDPFYRGMNATVAHVPGSGLGLAVARSIVDQHGGRLTIRQLTAGTEASVWLPWRASPQVTDTDD